MFKIIALIGEAGSGKDSVMQNILKKRPLAFNEIISCTTRPMREGEAEGVNYFYLTPEEFASKVLNGEMLEATSFNAAPSSAAASAATAGIACPAPLASPSRIARACR